MKKNSITQRDNMSSKEYAQFLEHIKTDVLQTQLKAALAITQELTLLYWRIGKGLSEKIKLEGWGTKVVEKLANDLESALPGLAGFSRTNIYRMMAFYVAYPNCPTAVGQLEETMPST